MIVHVGITMVITGVFQFISAPLAGRMFDSGVDKRLILAIGFGTFALGCYLNSFLTAESEYWEFFLTQVVGGLALMFCFMPINDLALGTMPKDEVQNASVLYNLTRNLRGAIGLAIINSLIISKSKIYAQGMKENISLTFPQVQERMDFFTQIWIGRVDNPELAALQLLDKVIVSESFIIAINNVFVIITILFCLGMILIPFLSMPKDTAGANAH